MKWREQIHELQIPYPQKTHLLTEIASHLEHFPEEANTPFEAESLEDLKWIHNNWLFRSLELMPRRIRRTIELVTALGPLAISTLFFSQEDRMLQFIHEGGTAMYAILAIGVLLLGRELQLAFRLLVVKDHARENLRIDSFAVVVGVLGLFFTGLAGTGLGIYVSADALARSQLPNSIFIAGLKESLTCVTLATALGSIVLLMHFCTRRLLTSWKVPTQLLD